MNRYTIFNMNINSDIDIPELPVGGGGEGEISLRLRDFMQTDKILSEDRSFVLSRRQDGSIEIVSKGVARYFLKDDVVDIFPENQAAIEMTRVPFLGVVLATLLVRQGWYVLHGSSVSVNGRAVAFIGNKYMGKSTLAASLVKRGHTLVTDDVVAIRIGDNSVPTIHPGPFGIKLWPEAIDSLSIGGDEVYPLFDGSAKDVLRTAGRHQEAPLPLDHVYVLGFGKAKEVLSLSPIDGITELMHNEYHNRYPDIDPNSSQRLLFNSAHLRRNVNMSALIRPVDKHGLDDIAKMVEQHVMSLTPGR